MFERKQIIIYIHIRLTFLFQKNINYLENIVNNFIQSPSYLFSIQIQAQTEMLINCRQFSSSYELNSQLMADFDVTY